MEFPVPSYPTQPHEMRWAVHVGIMYTYTTRPCLPIDRSSIKVVQATAKLVATPHRTAPHLISQLFSDGLIAAGGFGCKWRQAHAAGTGLAASLSPVGPSPEGGGGRGLLISATPTLSLFRDAPHAHTYM